MATVYFRQFTSPETLGKITPDRLNRLLLPHQTELERQGLVFDPEGRRSPDHARLIELLMDPDRLPEELLCSLYLIEEMANSDGMDALIRAFENAGRSPPAGDDLSPAEVALEAWLTDHTLLERCHAEQFVSRPRSFRSFLADDELPPLKAFTPELTDALECTLNDTFAKHKRGRSGRVFPFTKAEGATLLVRHGEPFRREESWENGESGSVAYRPLKYDVVRLVVRQRELRINAGSKWERELYAGAVAEHLFGTKPCFREVKRYTLEPLRKGPESLRYQDVPGLESVTLRAVQVGLGGNHRLRDRLDATDLFAALAEANMKIPGGRSILEAVFSFRLRGSVRSRTVKIQTPASASYTRDPGSELIETFLARRGFLVESDSAEESDDPFLVGA